MEKVKKSPLMHYIDFDIHTDVDTYVCTYAHIRKHLMLVSIFRNELISQVCLDISTASTFFPHLRST